MKNPKAPATSRQTFFIFMLTGINVRGRKMTRQQAHEKIQGLVSVVNDKPKKRIRPEAGNRRTFASVIKEAVAAADRAGDAWLKDAAPQLVALRGNTVIGELLDDCGIAHVQITDRRTAFARWLKEEQNGYNKVVLLKSRHQFRKELGLQEACANAALQVLSNHGIRGVSYFSRVV